MEKLKESINYLAQPAIYFIGSTVLFFAALYSRRVWTAKWGIGILSAMALFLGLSMFDPNFRSIVMKPDNVPIVGMIFLIGFFFWLAMKQAYENDERIAAGKDVMERSDARANVWPDLVYVELICLVLVSVLLIVWSIGIHAPLEQPAAPTKSPNPSKAPWYFLGLQEMLVYFDPWLAGVVFPSLIIFGLIAIPYIDKNPKGNGYYTFAERRFAITTFGFGFIILWISLIILGTFLRGPNWNFFGPYEHWDAHKVVPLNNVNLSEFIYVKWMQTGLPGHWLKREMYGILAVILYLFGLPPLLAVTVFRKFYKEMGFIRYNVMAILFLLMLALPIKMFLRWMFNLKYIVAIPEFFFNI